MTSENPLGEVLELVPKTSEPWRGSPSSRSPDGARSKDARTAAAGRPAPDSTTAARAHPPPAAAAPATQAPAEARPVVSPDDVPAKVLTPARVASWRSSSFDLLNGLTVNDVTDSIPGDVFDEIFREPQTPGRRPAPKPR